MPLTQSHNATNAIAPMEPEREASPAPFAIEMDRVSFAYGGDTVVEDVTLRIERGDFAVILGPNGSGKTTLIKLALGLIKPQSGSVRLLGADPARFADWRRVGYVPQVANGVHAAFPATVGEIVSHGRYAGFAPLAFWRGDKGADVDRALEIAGVSHLRRRRIGDLSAGQQQRALIARALVRSPELLALDEPIAGVDAHGEEQMYAVLRDLNAHGVTALMVSHDIGAVMREAKTVACVNRSLVCHCPPRDLTQAELARLYGFPVEALLHDACDENRQGALAAERR